MRSERSRNALNDILINIGNAEAFIRGMTAEEFEADVRRIDPALAPWK
jgi:hypothetical protein